MKRFFFLAILFFTITTLPCRAQCLQDAVWCFGDSAGIDFSDTANITTFKSSAYSLEAEASISDCDGILQFYTGNYSDNVNYFSAYNRLHLVIQNGDSLLGNETTTQGALILPFNFSQEKYFLFHLYPGNEDDRGLYYSIVDMSLNNGLGKVTLKNDRLGGKLTEKMCAVKNENNSGFWLLNLTLYSDTLIRYFVTDTIAGPFFQVLPEPLDSDGACLIGQMVFDQKGEKIALTCTGKGVVIFDFDRCTGLTSNMKVIGPEYYDPFTDNFHYGLCFSKNGRFLYCSQQSADQPGEQNADTLFQFDLESPNIYTSRYKYVTSEYIVCPNDYSLIGQLTLARDGKIYVANASTDSTCSTNLSLSVINSPNQKAPTCDFEQFSFYLGGERSFFSLPNMLNYNLGPIIPPIVAAGLGAETCSDQPVQLEAVSCSTCIYDWQPSEFLSNANIVNPIATVNTTTTFSLIVTDTSIHASCNKTSTDTVTVFVTDNTPSIQTLYIVSAGDEFFLLQDLKPNTSIEIISINGQRVYQTDSYQNDLELKNLSAGMYYYKMNLPGCYKLEGKFVVVR